MAFSDEVQEEQRTRETVTRVNIHNMHSTYTRVNTLGYIYTFSSSSICIIGKGQGE